MVSNVSDYPFNMGNHSFPVTVKNQDAQIWFDRGLMWCYGFNPEEAERCFHKALEADPDCAMAWWGVAYAAGPYYNKPWEWFDDKERSPALKHCFDALKKAEHHSKNASVLEQALITALSGLYPAAVFSDPSDYQTWSDSYAKAMRRVYQQNPDHIDVLTLTAEALMTRTPWKLWNSKTGNPIKGSDTLEAIEIIERGLMLSEKPHPGLLHLHIHAVEMSSKPERAVPSADLLRAYPIDSGHLNHMASHIDMLVGDYTKSVIANRNAEAKNDLYRRVRNADEFYTISCCHDIHMGMQSAMMMGHYGLSEQAAKSIKRLLPEKILRHKSKYVREALEGYHAAGVHLLVRFGRWQEIIDHPLYVDEELYLLSNLFLDYAKTVAYAATGDDNAAGLHFDQFVAGAAEITEEHVLGTNVACDILAVAQAMMSGERAYHRGEYEEAYDYLRHAVILDDALNYSEPWDWMHPPRHALGALLLAQGQLEEAEDVYKKDLCLISDNTVSRGRQHPDNIWSLSGLRECLQRAGKAREEKEINLALEKVKPFSDQDISVSCCCRNT